MKVLSVTSATVERGGNINPSVDHTRDPIPAPDGHGRNDSFRDRVRLCSTRAPSANSLLPLVCQQGNHSDQHEHSQAQSRHRWTSPANTPEPLHLADRPRLDRFIQQEAIQVIRQLLRRGVAAAWLLFQALQADRFQVARRSRVQRARRHRLVVRDLSQRFVNRFAGEGRLGGQQEIKNCAQRIDIARRSNNDAFARRLLRWHEIRRAENLSARGQIRIKLDPFGEAKISNARLIGVVNQHIGGF